tara:strand:+ start:7252 stop:8589 length:1338 start_codon:yes stop_codon:yes gene_type:complete
MWLIEKNTGSIVDNTFHSLFGYTELHDFKQRFATLKYVRDNELLTPNVKNEIFEVFVIYQRNIALLNNIARRIKYSKLPSGGEKCDLVGNNLDELPEHLKINIAHHGLKYTFRISDLINIINKSLTYREELFLLIQPVRNPYTNIQFSKAILLQIYMHIKRNTDITMPILFHLFYTTAFDKKIFSEKYEGIALDHSIENYIDEFEPAELVELAHEWIKIFKQTKGKQYTNLFIDKHYSRPKLIKELKPILKQYLISSNTLTSSIKYTSFSKACALMIKLLENNKDFGINTQYNDIKQVVFKSLAHINTHRFNANNEKHISVVNTFLNKDGDFSEFKYPNIRPFNDNIFIIRNYVNVCTSNSQQNIRNGNRVRRRIDYDNPYNQLRDNSLMEFINRLPDNASRNAVIGATNALAVSARYADISGNYNDISYDDDDDDDDEISIDSF